MASIGDLGITVESLEDGSLQFIIDAATGFTGETATDAAALSSGDVVGVQFPLPDFVDGELVQPEVGADIATQVTILPPGSEIEQPQAGRPGGGHRQGEAGAGGRGQRGFAQGPVRGSVTAVAEETITLALADGTERTVLVDPATHFVQQLDVERSVLAIGGKVRIAVLRGGFGRDAGGAETDGPRTASQVTIVGPSED